MSPENAEKIFQVFQTGSSYIKGLQIIENGKKIKLCNSINKTGFQGYVITMNSLSEIYNEFVVQKQFLKSIATHSVSQDHLEIFLAKFER